MVLGAGTVSAAALQEAEEKSEEACRLRGEIDALREELGSANRNAELLKAAAEKSEERAKAVEAQLDKESGEHAKALVEAKGEDVGAGDGPVGWRDEAGVITD